MAQKVSLPAPLNPMGAFHAAENSDVAGASRAVASVDSWQDEIPLYLRREGQIVYSDADGRRYRVAANLTDLVLSQEDIATALIAATRMAVYQVSGSIPQRPETTQKIDWYCWGDPSANMLPGDLHWQLDQPALPDAPNTAQLSKVNITAHLGNNNALGFVSVPVLVPPLTDLSYRIDGGSWLKAGISEAGESADMPVVATGPHTLEIAFDNFLGRGGSVSFSFTSHGAVYRDLFSESAVSGDHLGDRLGWRDHESEPHLRFDDGVDAGLSPGYFASSNNDISIGFAEFADLDKTAVWAEIEVEQDGIGQSCYVGIGGVDSYSLALRVYGASWQIRRNNTTVLYSGSVAQNIAKARLEVTATEIRAIINDVQVNPVTAHAYPQYLDGTQPVWIGVHRPQNSTNHDVFQNRIIAFEAGNL